MKAFDHGPEWVLVLPDQQCVRAVVGCLPHEATLTVRYPSGRPWLLIRTISSTVSLFRNHSNDLVLIGPGRVAPSRLEAALHVQGAGALERVLQTLPGAFHVLARLDKQQLLRGTATGIRRLFFRRLEALPGSPVVVADRADLIAQIGSDCGLGADPDLDAVALRLLEPIPHPLADVVPWKQVQAVPPGHRLAVGPSCSTRLERWWNPPEAILSAKTGAPAVRKALVQAVRLHIEDRQRISTELSGGLDSTSVTATAAHVQDVNNGKIDAITVSGRDPLEDDTYWAALAARTIPNLDHHVLGPHKIPLVYAGIGSTSFRLDEPCFGQAHRLRVLAVVAHAAEMGSQVHLTGHGGDHLFMGVPTLYLDLIKRQPIKALQRLNAYRGMFGWSRAATARQLLGRSTYSRWLERHCITREDIDFSYPLLSWGTPAKVRPWFTQNAVDAIRSQVQKLVDQVEPHRPSPGTHAEIESILDGARMVRGLSDFTSQVGLPIAAPFLDDRVVEAALAIRIEEKVDPWQYKPLLREAVRDIVPAPLLARTTKGVGSIDESLGLRLHRDELGDLWKGSRLGAAGLVDDRMLLRLCTGPDRPELRDGALLSTVSCEAWLRHLDYQRIEAE